MIQSDIIKAPGTAWRVCHRLLVSEVELVSSVVSNEKIHFYCEDGRRHSDRDLYATFEQAARVALSKVDAQLAVLASRVITDHTANRGISFQGHIERLRSHRDSLLAELPENARSAA